MTVNLKNEDNHNRGTTGGNPTWDKFFLLSLREADLFFKDDDDRICYDKDKRENVRWWLRSSGFSDISAANVNNEGSIRPDGSHVHYGRAGVRPAFYLDLKY